MCRSSRNNEICFESLEKALAQNPETYQHLDIITFGFPCQDISNANPKGKGLKGKRSSIFFECMRIVKLLIPQWLLIENVPRLLSINNGRDMVIVLQELAKSGYGWSYRILDSQYFGVAQRRRRVFIVGYFGGLCPPEILFEPKGSNGNDKKKQKTGSRGLCISTRDGERQDPTSETFIASTSRSNDHDTAARSVPNNIVAQTIGATPRGNSSFVWQDAYIAKTNTSRKRATTGISRQLDAPRGIVIGNAVSVPVAEWIGKRIIEYEQKRHLDI